MIEDEELIRIAVFRLTDTARRLADLSDKADSPRLMARLRALSAQLEKLKGQLCEVEGRAGAGNRQGKTVTRAGGTRVAG